jgi:hypothetical protein
MFGKEGETKVIKSITGKREIWKNKIIVQIFVQYCTNIYLNK